MIRPQVLKRKEEKKVQYLIKFCKLLLSNMRYNLKEHQHTCMSMSCTYTYVVKCYIY